MNPAMKTPVMEELNRNFPNLITIASNMQNPKKEKQYNPDHPATLDRICASIHPAGELLKLGLQVAIENPQAMQDLQSLDTEAWSEMGKSVKEVAKKSRRSATDLLALAQRWYLRDLIVGRFGHMLETEPTPRHFVLDEELVEEICDDGENTILEDPELIGVGESD